MKKFALLSVFDKSEIEKIAQALVDDGYHIIATEGTGKILAQHGIEFISADIASGNPNSLKDCIQTIGFKIAAGILFNRENGRHLKQVDELSINSIDAVVCNFPPPFEYIKSAENFNIQHVDVGGPLMVRAAATNYKQVLIITSVDDYHKVIAKINKKSLTLEFRKKLALKAFAYCRKYDAELIKFLKSV